LQDELVALRAELDKAGQRISKADIGALTYLLRAVLQSRYYPPVL